MQVMHSDMLRGELVKLTAENPEVMAGCFVRWNQDTEWLHLLDTDPPRMPSEKKWKEWLEKDLEKEESRGFYFAIRALENEELIGFIGLFDLFLNHGDALVAIALGERQYWGKGYGTDAMRILQGYAFNELNLRRLGLIVFEYNHRAIRSYEKAGFIHEGRVRQTILRDGKRWDFLYMGILREEWQASEAVPSGLSNNGLNTEKARKVDGK
jgi:RimJ/RimL family protein N-acetyltransferase